MANGRAWIRVLLIRTWGEVRDRVQVREIAPALSAMQALVGGSIERIPVARELELGQGVDLWVNEEGRLLGLSYNVIASALVGELVLGDAFLCRSHPGERGDYPVSLTDSDIAIIHTALGRRIP
jgi:hypothetical protein